MKSNLLSYSLFLVIFGLAALLSAGNLQVACADSGEPAVVTDVVVQDNSVIITSNRHFIYTLYSANDPYKVSLDIPDMKAGAFTRKIVSEKSGITEIIPSESTSPKPAVKFEIMLQNPSSVVPIYTEGKLVLNIKPEEPVVLAGSAGIADEAKESHLTGKSAEVKDEAAAQPANAHSPETSEKAAPAAETSVPAEKAVSAESLAHATEINRIELRKSLEALTVALTGNGALKPNVFPLDGRIVIDVPGVAMRAAVPSGFIPPLKGMRVGKYKDKVRIVLDLREKTDYRVDAEGAVLAISLKRPVRPAIVHIPEQQEKAAEPATKIEETKKTDEPKKIEKKVAERIAALESHPVKPVEKPVGDAEGNGTGQCDGKKISLDFQDADVSSIFRLLADVSGCNLVLDKTVQGRKIPNLKLMNVAWAQALDIVCKSSDLAFRINGNILWIAPPGVFAKVEEDKKKARDAEEQTGELDQEIIRVNYATSAEIKAAIDQGKLLSPRGTVTVDARMNTLIVKDTAKSIQKVRDLIKIMDVSKPQVMIEAKLVQVSSDYSDAFGIRWGGQFTNPTWPTPVAGGFSVNTPTTTTGSAASVTGGSVGLTVGYANTLKVDLSLSALETVGKSKTLSNPKILTMDNEKAQIQQGSTFYIATTSQAGTQTQAQSATLSLEVTPKITPDGYVQIKVKATDNSLVSVDPVPVVDTKSMETIALVKNGETLVLGGIYTSTKTEGETAVPLLSKVPGLGWLFKTKNEKSAAKELLIFITPSIVQHQ